MRVLIRSYLKNAVRHNMKTERNTNPCGYRMELVTRAHMYAMFKAVQNMLMLTGCKYRGISVPKTYILAKNKTPLRL